MKVCKFEKMKEEDEIRQVINYILKEHPYVVVVPTLTQLQEWLQDISISWFHEEDSASHTTINNIEEYCCTLADHLITDLPLNTDIKKYIRECIEKMHKLVEDKADLLIDKINTWREDKFERSVANGTETVFVTLRFCVVRKQLKATLKPNAAGVQLPPHYYRNG